MSEQTTPVDDARSVEDTAAAEAADSAEITAPAETAATVANTVPAQASASHGEPVPAGDGQPVEGPSMAPPSPEDPPLAAPATESSVKVKKDRRVLRAVLRWSAATLVFAAVGSASAYGITGLDRTDVPGLATQSDGRWDYPTIVKPPLPSGSPGPFAASNKAGVHSADLRKLLLPAPEGATADAALRGEDGWLARKDFVAGYAAQTDRDTVGQLLTDYAVRHIAARGWTTTDGTHTRIYLLQFDTAAVAEDLITNKVAFYDSPQVALRGATTVERDEEFPDRAAVDQVTRYAYAESKPYGAEGVRQAYLSAGDVVALVVQSRKGSAPEIPFQQTVVLQSQLLG
ncbi:hypothetical protein ACWD4F_30275 [Streptomyces aureus]